jgi:predicted transposase YbfD/YdcC
LARQLLRAPPKAPIDGRARVFQFLKMDDDLIQRDTLRIRHDSSSPAPLSWSPHRERYTRNPPRAQTLQITRLTYKCALALVQGGADYVLALKGNQGTLHQSIIEHIDEQLEGDLAEAQEHVTSGKGHGREETRIYLQLPAPEELPGFVLWKGLKSIGLVTSQCVRDGKTTVEARYYISSLKVDVKQFARAVRGHWSIENGCHWNLDMTFREDESRLRDRHLRENFAWLNRFTLSLLKQHPGRQSLVMKRRSCGWSDAFLMEVVTGSTC